MFYKAKLSKWETRIYHLNLKELFDFDALLAETLAAVDLRLKTIEEDFCTANTTPLLARLREEVVLPQALAYMAESWDYHLTTEQLRYRSWFNGETHGRGLSWHHHPNAQLSTVLYLKAEDGPITFMDPRGNACRGYPSEIIAQHFNNQTLHIETGDLVIFPSYLAHLVEPYRPVLRIVMATDFFIEP